MKLALVVGYSDYDKKAKLRISHDLLRMSHDLLRMSHDLLIYKKKGIMAILTKDELEKFDEVAAEGDMEKFDKMSRDLYRRKGAGMTVEEFDMKVTEEAIKMQAEEDKKIITIPEKYFNDIVSDPNLPKNIIGHFALLSLINEHPESATVEFQIGEFEDRYNAISEGEYSVMVMKENGETLSQKEFEAKLEKATTERKTKNRP